MRGVVGVIARTVGVETEDAWQRVARLHGFVGSDPTDENLAVAIVKHDVITCVFCEKPIVTPQICKIHPLSSQSL